MEKTANQKLGSSGEGVAEQYLKTHGFEIVSRNYSCKGGELDLVAVKKNALHFIEVKSRSSVQFGDPLEAVGNIKQQRLSRAAQYYLLSSPQFHSFEKFFSVIGIHYTQHPPLIEWIPNAFELWGGY